MLLYIVSEIPCCEHGFIRKIFQPEFHTGISNSLFTKQNSLPYLQCLWKPSPSHLDYQCKKLLTSLPVCTFPPYIPFSTQLPEWSFKMELRSGCFCDQTFQCLLMSQCESPFPHSGLCDPACYYLFTVLPSFLTLLEPHWPPCGLLHVAGMPLLPLDFCTGCYSAWMLFPNSD